MGFAVAARIANFSTRQVSKVTMLVRSHFLSRSLHHRAASSHRGSVMVGVGRFVVAQPGVPADAPAFGGGSLATLGAAEPGR